MGGIDFTISSVVGVVQQTILTVAPALFGAALFARHPDARSTDARLVFGIGLLVVVTILGLASGFIGDLFSNAGDDLGLGPTPAGVGLRALRGLLTAFALVYVARGLLDARTYEDDPGAPRRTRLLAMLAIAGIVVEVLILLDWIRRGEVDLSGTLFLADFVVAIISLALVLSAQAYLVATSWTGARSSERPTAAWRWAAIGWGAIFIAELVSILVSLVAALLPPADLAGSLPYTRAFEVGGWVSTLGWVAAIWAFVLGLPRLATGETVDDGDEGPDATDEASADARVRRRAAPRRRSLAPVDRERRREVVQEVDALVDRLHRRVGSRQRKHGRPARATPWSWPHGSSR